MSDFAGYFDLKTVLLVTALSVVGKFLGAWFGTLMVAMPKLDRIPIALAHTPGGPMGVLLASVAKDAEVIGPQMFVALVVASIVSSLFVGPAFTWALHRNETHDVAGYFARNRVVWGLQAKSREEAIAALAAEAAKAPGMPALELIRETVSEREKTMGTGVGSGIAIPHARIEELSQPLVVVGVSQEGIEWDAIDGKPAHLVFLILTAIDENDTQLEILSTIAGAFSGPSTMHEIVDAGGAEQAWELVASALMSAEASA